MDGPYVDDFGALSGVEVAKLDKNMAKDYEQAIHDAARRGLLQSSMSMQMVQKATANTLPVRAQMAFNILMRSMEAHGVPITGANKDEVSAFLGAWINDQKAKAVDKMLKTAPFKQKLEGNWMDPLLAELGEIAHAEGQRIAGELNLIAARNARTARDNSGGGSSFVFNAPVGLVQTGAGSFGVAHQHIDGATKASLNEALDRLLHELDEADGDLDFDAGEVRAVVVCPLKSGPP